MHQVKIAAVIAALMTILSIGALADTKVGEGTLQTAPTTGAPTQGEQRVGTVGSVETPPEQPTTNLAPSVRPQPARRPAAAPLQRWQTEEGFEEASHRVLRGDFALKHHSHHHRSKAIHSTHAGHKTSHVAKKASVRPTITNITFNTPPTQPAPSHPETPEERKEKMQIAMVVMGGFVIVFLVAALVGGILGILALQNAKKDIEEKTKRDDLQTRRAEIGKDIAFKAIALAADEGEKASVTISGHGIYADLSRDRKPGASTITPVSLPITPAAAVVAPVPPPPAPPTPAAPSTPPAAPAAPVTAAALTAAAATP